jgi:hypothetical protein
LCYQLVAVVTIIFRSSLVGVCGGVEDKVTEGWVGLRGWWHWWLCCQLVAVIILVCRADLRRYTQRITESVP